MESAQPIDPASLAEKEKYFRYEKISEIFTYLGILSGFILAQLRYTFPVEKRALYLLFGFVIVFAFVWFRLLPKFVGFKKTFIYYFCSVIFVGVAIHYTNGIQSFAIFFFYLTVLGAAAAIPVRYFLIVVFTICGFIVGEAFLFSSLSFFQSGSLAVIHIWGLFIIGLYGKVIFNEERLAKATEMSDRLKVAKQIDLVKNEFVFVISNKLRQPILSLQNYLDSAFKAKNQTWTPDFTELLTKTRENSQRLARLVNDLTDLSRIENQKLSLDLQPIELNGLIGSTLSDFSMSASEKSVALKYSPNQENVTVLADSSRLHEILANLVDNAIKYSPENTTIEISFTKTDGYAQISVSDHGYGIPDEAKQHLFEKFYRVNRSATEAKGTGLGLFVTKELVERQGGKIWFESQVGKGTTFYFTLPLKKADGK